MLITSWRGGTADIIGDNPRGGAEQKRGEDSNERKENDERLVVISWRHKYPPKALIKY